VLRVHGDQQRLHGSPGLAQQVERVGHRLEPDRTDGLAAGIAEEDQQETPPEIGVGDGLSFVVVEREGAADGGRKRSGFRDWRRRRRRGGRMSFMRPGPDGAVDRGYEESHEKERGGPSPGHGEQGSRH
jgi:hypothetical protein